MSLKSKAIEQFVNDNESIRRWLSKLGKERTRSTYLYHFYQYFERYIKAKGLFNSPDELLRNAENCDNKQIYQHIDWVEDYLKNSDWMKGTTVSHRANTYKAFRSFYQENRISLPKYTIRYGDDVPRGREQEAVTLDEVKKLILSAKPRDRTIFLCMLQGGIGIEEMLNQFNYNAFGQICRQLGYDLKNWDLSKPLAVRIDVTRKKNGYKYYTFISNDAIEAIRDWLIIREMTVGKAMKVGEPLFITNRFKPPTHHNIQSRMRGVGFRSGLMEHHGKREGRARIRYKFHPHELRDTFESTCAMAGIDRAVREFFLGHTIDRLGYDKSPWLYPDHFKQQYLKVVRHLNILSKPVETEDVRKEMLLQLFREQAKVFEIDPMRIRIEKEKEIGRELSVDEEINLMKSKIVEEVRLMKYKEGKDKERFELNGGGLNPQYEHKLVMEESLISHVDQGWEVLKEFSNRKILIRRLKQFS